MNYQTIKWLGLGLIGTLLSGCLGGTIAQQVARSILMQGADKITANAIEAHELKEKIAAQNAPLKNGVPNEYQLAFWNSGFENIKPVIEPLPDVEPVNAVKTLPIIKENQLIQVEIWSFLVGDEKQHILEKARMQGATSIPPKSEWQQWQLAVGEAKERKQAMITFLIPPEIGKMHSGNTAFVEISSVGEMNVARYPAN